MQSWIHVIEWRATVRPDVTALVDDRGAEHSYAALRAEFTALVDAVPGRPELRVAIGGGGPVPAGWLDGGALSGAVPPRPALGGGTATSPASRSTWTRGDAPRSGPRARLFPADGCQRRRSRPQGRRAGRRYDPGLLRPGETPARRRAPPCGGPPCGFWGVSAGGSSFLPCR
jgi:hypothetical protein